MRVSLRNNKGFSLVELMVVVAIIGILAAIAVPNFQRFTAKSKQSEAKSNLSAIYAAERSFFAEWNQFVGGFGDIGYLPQGMLRYNHGFSASNTRPPLPYPTNAGVAPADINTGVAAVCGLTGAINLATGCGVVILPNPPGAIAGAASLANAFDAQARGDIDGDATIDIWQIDENKVLNQPIAGNTDVTN